MDKRMLIAGGVLAVAALIGSQMESGEKPEQAPLAVQIAQAKEGEEIRALRGTNCEVFKADSAWVKTASGDSVKAPGFMARVYASQRYWRDADADTLRPLDLAVHEISALARLNPLRTHDWYVDAGPYTAQWMDDKPADYRMDAGEMYVKFRALTEDKGLTVKVEPTATGMKETVTLADKDAPHTLRWLVETDGSLVADATGGFRVRAKDGTFPMAIVPPNASDAAGLPVMAVASLVGDTLAFRVTVLPGQEYPVTVDPTTSVTGASNDGRASSSNAVYLTSRNGAGNDHYHGYLPVGQTNSNYNIDRTFLCFPGIPQMSSASACTLYVHGESDHSTTDFEIYLFGARAWKSELTIDDFTHFNGWQSSGTYTGTILNNTWNSSSYSAVWNNIVFNAAGLDSLKAAAGDSLWLAMISKEDYDASQPSTEEWVRFKGNIFGSEADYISFSYTGAYTNPPTGFTLHTPTTSSLKASWTNHHSGSVDSLRIFTGAGAWVKTLAKTDTTTTITGLSLNTQYIYKARVDSSSSYGYSNADTLSTLANPPVNWNFTEDYTDSTKITIGFGTNGNPAGTVYAIRDSTNQKWISATGDTTSAATWRTSAQWTSTAKLINRNPSKKHILGVVARNGDGVQTAYTWGSLAIGNVRLAQLSAVQPYTHNGKSTVYSNQARTTNVDSIRTVAADTLGQRLSGSDYQTWRVSLQFVLPNFDTAIADTLQVTGAGDQSATDFTVMASKGLWASPDNVDTRYSHFSGYSSGVFSTTNWFNSWSTSSYGSTMNWIMNVTGLTWVTQARGDTLRMVVFSSRDSSATAPTGNEYLRVSNPTLRMSYVLTDKVPSNIVATSISPDSILVTWTDNSTTETGFALVNALTGLRMGANDSTAANVTFKRYGGLSPNTEYAVKVMALGGKLAGDISTSADSCYTKANTPGKPTASILGDNRLAFALDPNGNSAFTRFAVEDSVSGRYADATAEPETLRAGPLGEWGWRTYAGWGGAGGDTLAGIRPGDFYTIRAKARNGQ